MSAHPRSKARIVRYDAGQRAGRVRGRAGFTLIEVSIVVAIIGILASIVVPIAKSWRNDAQRVAFVSSLKTFANSGVQFVAETGMLPPGGRAGQLPVYLERYIRKVSWEQQTPIGGLWDIDTSRRSGWCRMGVLFGQRDDRHTEFMANVDAMVDDGHIGRGDFRRVGFRKYMFYVVR